jgi:hypothetical protein
MELTTEQLTVQIDENSLTVAVIDNRTGLTWRMQEEGPGDIGIRGHSGPWTGLPFRAAGKTDWKRCGNRAVATLTALPYRGNAWGPLDFVVFVEFEVRGRDVHVRVRTRNGRGEASFIDSYYPRGFLFPEDTDGRLVLPYGQGCLLDKNDPVTLDHTLTPYVGQGFSMPWWGQIADSGEGIVALVHTPDDVSFRLVTDPEGGQTAHPCWLPSLGNFRYPRAITYRFFENADVVTLAREYRRHAEGRGLAVTLKDKAAARPAVRKLRGSMIVNLWAMSDFDKFDKGVRMLTFEEGLRRYRRFVEKADLGEDVILHVDGWGQRGYDFMHPDVLPPDGRLGGWEGLQRLAEGAKSLGHGFLLHDNYVDVYHRSDAFGPDNIVTDLSYVTPENDEWLGGRQGWMCPKRTLEFARRNLTRVQEKLQPTGTYLDCLTFSHLRECYNQEHPCSRDEARQAWTEVFRMCQDQFGWATSSEGGADWAIPVLDFCWCVYPALAPFDLREDLDGPLGKPIPLYGLVWHDCIVTPGFIRSNAAQNASPIGLWVLLWGGIPSIRPDCFEPRPGNEDTSADIDGAAAFAQSLSPLMETAGAVGFEPMTDLEILDADASRQRTTFGDGTTVLVDFAEERYRVEFADGGTLEGNGDFTG